MERIGGSYDDVWRSVQLDPSFPEGVAETLPQAHLTRYGVGPTENQRRLDLVTRQAEQVGLTYRLDQALVVNTLDAHRFVHHASAHGKGMDAAELLMRAYAIEGRSIAEPTTLTEIAAELEIPEPRPGAYAGQVRADQELAREYGISGVPTLVVGGRYALVSPETDDIVRALDQLGTIPAHGS